MAFASAKTPETVAKAAIALVREVLLRGSISTVELLVLTSLNQLIFILKMLFSLYITSYLYGEVNCTDTEPSPSVRVFPALALRANPNNFIFGAKEPRRAQFR